MASVSIKDVAHAAGVSVGTVTNVLNRPTSSARPTRRRADAIEELGYVRNESARQLRSGPQPHGGQPRPRRGQPVLHRRGARHRGGRQGRRASPC